MFRALATATMIATAALTLSGGHASRPAAAAEVDLVKIQNVGNTSMCLDSNSSGSVYMHQCISGDDNQAWVWVSGIPGQLQDYATGRCLDSNDNGGLGTLPCNSSGSQQWDYESGGRQQGQIGDGTGRCLDSSSGMNATSCDPGNTTPGQDWTISADL